MYGSDSETTIVKAFFQGFLSVNEFDGTNLERPQDVVGNIDRTAAFMGSALQAYDGGKSLVVGLIATQQYVCVSIHAIFGTIPSQPVY